MPVDSIMPIQHFCVTEHRKTLPTDVPASLCQAVRALSECDELRVSSAVGTASEMSKHAGGNIDLMWHW